MLTINSKTDKNKIYFFESLGYITPEDLLKGYFSGIPGKLESTLELPSPNPLEKDEEKLIKIINDCDLAEINVAHSKADGFCAVYYFLKTKGVHRLPYNIHTLTKI
ncbi:MAG: hypothetical protein ACP5N1_01600 [Candidatus Woesearchaeota archaeon]